MKIKPLFDRIVVVPSQRQEISQGGLYLTSSSEEKPQIGEVVAVGEGGVIDGKEIVMQIKVGDKVLFPKYSGSEIKLDNKNMIVLRQSDVLAILED